MPKYVFQPAQGEGDPLIKRIEGQSGTLDFLLIHPANGTSKRSDIIYYALHKHPGHYDTFRISTGPSDSSGNKLTSSGLEYFSDRDLEIVSQATSIPIEELVEVREIKRANFPIKPAISRNATSHIR